VAGAAVAAVVVFAAVAAVASLQQDLVAYWVAGSVRRLGLDPYLNHALRAPGAAPWDGSIFHHSRFLYPPLAAELFRPLALLPYRAAKVVFTAIVGTAWIAATLVLARGRRAGAAASLSVALAGALFFPLALNLERGQIDVLLLLVVVVAWNARANAPLAGGLLALAGVFKPALLGVLPVLAALGRWRWVGAALAWSTLALLLTFATSGAALVREYATSVLPRAVLYGEGGSDEMAFHARELEPLEIDEHGERQSLDGRSYPIALPLFDGPVSASIPRLLAPAAPSWPTSLLPYLMAAAGLVWAARRRARGPRPRRADDNDDDEILLLTAALVACVVTSPAGWAMGLVFALPLAPVLWTRAGAAALAPAARWAVRGAWIACALPAPFSGWAALAGAALVVAASAAAATEMARP
jgi:hypothetical protein